MKTAYSVAVFMDKYGKDIQFACFAVCALATLAKPDWFGFACSTLCFVVWAIPFSKLPPPPSE